MGRIARLPHNRRVRMRHASDGALSVSGSADVSACALVSARGAAEFF